MKSRICLRQLLNLFIGWYDFLGGKSKTQQTQREALFAQINQEKSKVGLAPLTGNISTDKPMLQRKCAAGISGSCRIIGQTVPRPQPKQRSWEQIDQEFWDGMMEIAQEWAR